MTAIFCGHGIGGARCAEVCVATLQTALQNPYLRARLATCHPAGTGQAALPGIEAAMAELFWQIDAACKRLHRAPPGKVTIADEFGPLKFELNKEGTEYECSNRMNFDPCVSHSGISARGGWGGLGLL